MGNLLIIDDQDRSIQYSGSWSSEGNVGDLTNEYLNTVHKSSTVGDSLQYSFVGTGISVFGTLNMPQSLGLPTPSFAIDDNDATAFNSSGESPALPKGTHTINIAIASPTGTTSTTPGPFYFDFFTVDSAGGSVAGDVILDDRDLRLLYAGTWGFAGAPEEYMGTTRVSPDAGNQGTMIFQFTGTALTLFGATNPTTTLGPTKILFNLDGQLTTFDGRRDQPAIRHQVLFQAISLGTDNTHTLTVTPQNGNNFFVDYIVYRTTNFSAETTASTTPGGGTSTSIRSMTTSLSSITSNRPASTSTSTRMSPSSISSGTAGKAPNIGAIAGGVVGGVTFLAFAILGLYLWEQRRNKAHNFAKELVSPYHARIDDNDGPQYTESHSQAPPPPQYVVSPSSSYPQGQSDKSRFVTMNRHLPPVSQSDFLHAS